MSRTPSRARNANLPLQLKPIRPARLTTADWEALQRAILALHSERDLKKFRDALPRVLLALIPADYFVWNEMQFTPERVHTVDLVESEPGTYARFRVLANRYLLEHPFNKPFLDEGGPSALKLSDFGTRVELRRFAFFRDAYEGFGYPYLIAVPIPLHPGLVSGLNFLNRTRDLSERDRAVLNAIRPHFRQAYQNAELATARATALSQPLIRFQLTQRESEIGIWLAEGKTNSEIAAILGLSPRTVEKHVESILQKLGVENRATAAVTIANAKLAGSQA